MDESKELQGLYTIFRATIYISLLLEFFMYALDPSSLDFLGGLITNIHSRLQLLSVYQFLPYSKMVTVMLVIITCIGTKNKSVPTIMSFRTSGTTRSRLSLFLTATTDRRIYSSSSHK